MIVDYIEKPLDKIEISLYRINLTKVRLRVPQKKIIWINSFKNNDKLYVLNEVKSILDPEIQECFIMWTSTDDNPVKQIIYYDDRKDKQTTGPFDDDDFMKPYVEDENKYMNKPARCPEQHALIWIDSEIAICKDGHQNIVWVLAENSRLRIEVNATARLIANKLKETLDTKEVVIKTVIQYYPKLYTKEEYYTWRLHSTISTTELAKKLKLSRGLMFDVDTGRRPYSDFFCAKFTQFMIDNQS